MWTPKEASPGSKLAPHQNIAYFATTEGLPTNLEFTQGSFGPFASAVKTMESRLVQNGLIQERSPTGRMYHIEVGPHYEDAIPAYGADLEKWSPEIDRVADLFMRLHNTQQAEIAATVHYAAHNLVGDSEHRPTELDVFRAVKQWKVRRKPPLRDDQVATMIRNLNLLGWLDLEASSDLPVPKQALVDELDLV